MNYIILDIVKMYMTDDEFYEITYVDYIRVLFLLKIKLREHLLKLSLKKYNRCC